MHSIRGSDQGGKGGGTHRWSRWPNVAIYLRPRGHGLVGRRSLSSTELGWCSAMRTARRPTAVDTAVDGHVRA